MAFEASREDGVEVVETRAGKFQVTVCAGGLEFLADEPTEVGGLGSGPNPYDLLCSALGACTVMTLRLYADRKGWKLARTRVRVLHHSNGLNARDRFAREISLEGELSEDQRRRLLEIAGRCPVHLTLERGSDVVTVLADRLDRSMIGDSPQHAADMDETCCD
jgi:putative redox protein